MKLTRLTAFLLAGATVFSAAALTSCKKNPAGAPDNPFEQGTDPISQGSNQLTTSGQNDVFEQDPSSWLLHPNSWTPNEITGEKRLYGIIDRGSGVIRSGNMYVKFGDACRLNYFSLDDPYSAEHLCFDPLCEHLPQSEDCSAIINVSFGSYPYFMYFDEYESPNSPVIYLSYRRNENYWINDIGATREPVYCIERFDLSKGKREVVLDNIKYTVQQICNYGDYIYYVLDMGEGEGQMLYRLYKAGGNPEQLDQYENVSGISIVDVVEDKLYYTVNSRYIFRCDLNLTGSEKVLDMSEIKSKGGKNGIVAGSYSGYLYYFADIDTEYSKPNEQGFSIEKCNLYRIPMNDLTAASELVVENMIYSSNSYYFTEETLYYEPCVFKSVDRSEESSHNSYTDVNTCDGKLYALNLKTAESKLIVENSGLTIYPKYAWDDIVLFTGHAYNQTGVEYSDNNNNLIIAYASGEEPYKVLCRFAALGYVRK